MAELENFTNQLIPWNHTGCLKSRNASHERNPPPGPEVSAPLSAVGFMTYIEYTLFAKFWEDALYKMRLKANYINMLQEHHNILEHLLWNHMYLTPTVMEYSFSTLGQYESPNLKCACEPKKTWGSSRVSAMKKYMFVWFCRANWLFLSGPQPEIQH